MREVGVGQGALSLPLSADAVSAQARGEGAEAGPAAGGTQGLLGEKVRQGGGGEGIMRHPLSSAAEKTAKEKIVGPLISAVLIHSLSVFSVFKKSAESALQSGNIFF
jgi:hypothetical protein